MGDGASGEDLVTLDTPRLILRQWQPTDLDRYVEMFADPEVARYIFRGQPARREQVTEMSGNYLRQWRDLGLGPFAAIDKATGAWIGQMGSTIWPTGRGRRKSRSAGNSSGDGGGAGWPPKAGARPFGRLRGARAAADNQHGGTDNHASRHVMDKLGLTYGGTHVISDAEIVWYAIDNPDENCQDPGNRDGPRSRPRPASRARPASPGGTVARRESAMVSPSRPRAGRAGGNRGPLDTATRGALALIAAGGLIGLTACGGDGRRQRRAPGLGRSQRLRGTGSRGDGLGRGPALRGRRERGPGGGHAGGSHVRALLPGGIAIRDAARVRALAAALCALPTFQPGCTARPPPAGRSG